MKKRSVEKKCLEAHESGMALDFIIAGIMVAGVLAYLAYTLIYPERF